MNRQIVKVCDEVKELLLAKNKAYGNSVGEPMGIFSKTTALEQIDVRIDDKLSRIARGHEFQGDDTELDLIGYLIIKRALRRMEDVHNITGTDQSEEEQSKINTNPW